MSGTYIQVAVDGAGKKVDTRSVNDGSNDLNRQVIVSGDPSDINAIQAITNSDPSSQSYGAVTRPVLKSSVEANIQNVADSTSDILHKMLLLLRRLVKPVFWNPTSNRIMCTGVIESGTITTVTNLSNLGSFTSDGLVRAQTRSTWYNSCRSRIS